MSLLIQDQNQLESSTKWSGQYEMLSKKYQVSGPVWSAFKIYRVWWFLWWLFSHMLTECPKTEFTRNGFDLGAVHKWRHHFENIKISVFSLTYHQTTSSILNDNHWPDNITQWYCTSDTLTRGMRWWKAPHRDCWASTPNPLEVVATTPKRELGCIPTLLTAKGPRGVIPPPPAGSIRTGVLPARPQISLISKSSIFLGTKNIFFC